VTTATVMVVEDDESVAHAVTASLTTAGFRSVVARSGCEAIVVADDVQPALILLDLGLPDIDGLQLCRRFRDQAADRPIIIVTGRDADIDVVVGLDAGANDYVSKPFSTGVLLARVRAQLRDRDERRHVVEVGALRLDQAARVVTLDGDVVELRPREFSVLEQLMREAGRVVTRDDLLRRLWGDEWSMASNRALDVHVVSLRRKLGDDAAVPRWIHTVRSIGYRFAAA
jgi:DNA-binding response OmpR family regulator